MPNVNGMNFPYTPEGMRAAEEARKRIRPTEGAYKYGGRIVPGMFKGGSLPKARDGFPHGQGQFDPNRGSNIPISAPTNPGMKTNWMQRLGRSFGNVFRGGKSPFGPDVDINRMNDPNWRMPNAPSGYSYAKHGKSTGPNKML
jgi:hypothetical protein